MPHRPSQPITFCHITRKQPPPPTTSRHVSLTAPNLVSRCRSASRCVTTPTPRISSIPHSREFTPCASPVPDTSLTPISSSALATVPLANKTSPR
ncbi:hypothetical protein Sjap_016637 [Stephania japonica]|uniref:Uncharacterized protein n=1 Tax=Stephania japonica TaxID=461633 RepID=A0AAP0IM90_9MAGN